VKSSTKTTTRVPWRPDDAEVSGVRPRATGVWFIAGCVLVAIAGAAAGAFAGLPGLVDRAGERALRRLEERFGVRLEAAEVAWTWHGEVHARGVVVRAAGSEAVLATIAGLAVQAEVDLWNRRVQLVKVDLTKPVLKVTRDTSGATNLDGLIAGLKRAAEGNDGGEKLGGGVTIAPEVPVVAMEGLVVAIDAALPPLPLGLTLPGKATFEGGRVTFQPAGPPQGGLLTTPMRIDLAFASTSLDPGQALTLTAEGPLGGPPTLLELRPARPMRFWLKQRVVGIGGVALTSRGIELGPLQLSVPLARGAGATEVAAAASFEKIALATAPGELWARVTTALARSQDHAALQSVLVLALGALDEIKLVNPVITLAIDEAGHHSYEDLLPDLRVAQEPVAQGLDRVAETGLVQAVIDANVLASQRLLSPERSPKPEKGAAPALSVRMSRYFTELDQLSRERLPALVRALTARLVSRLVVSDGELILALPETTSGRFAPDAALEAAMRVALAASTS